MVEVSSKNNIYNVQATSGRQSVRVGAASKKNVNEVEASNDESRYWAGIAENFANQAQQSAINAESTVSSAISDIQAQELSSIENIQNETADSLEQLQDKYNELREKLATTYIHEQATASNIWQIEHNLNKKPSIMVVDTADTVIEGVEKYIDENNVEIYFNAAVKGKAYLN